MTASRALTPLGAALLGLLGALGATLYLHRAASAALDTVLEERLRGAGETAAEWLGRTGSTAESLRAVMRANGLEGAYVVSRDERLVADATGPAGGAPGLLRFDGSRAASAFAGQATVDFAFAVGELRVATGYFPVRAPSGEVTGVLALEAGQSFSAARAGLRRALWGGVGLSLLAALALGALSLQRARAEELQRKAAARAAQGEAMSRMAAMAAHEIRNPIGIIRAAIELVRERSGSKLPHDDQEALEDALGEIGRLKRLTEDFLDLSREASLAVAPLDLADLATEAARASSLTSPGVGVDVQVASLRLEGDPARLRQVLANLLTNAAQAGAKRIEIRGEAVGDLARLTVRDDGPGLEPSLRGRLFEPFATGRKDGTGLGLAIARRIVERHGGTLRLAAGGPPGATFELSLPLRAGLGG